MDRVAKKSAAFIARESRCCCNTTQQEARSQVRSGLDQTSILGRGWIGKKQLSTLCRSQRVFPGDSALSPFFNMKSLLKRPELELKKTALQRASKVAPTAVSADTAMP